MLLAVLSPAKSLDYDSPVPTMPRSQPLTQPQFMAQAAQLVSILRPMSPAALASLMSISDKLAVLNASRYQQWSQGGSQPSTPGARAAVFAFNGDVYEGLDAHSLSAEELGHLNQHLLILSGLYGVLRPLDVLQPYRLEMGTALANPSGRDLYAFWRPKLAGHFNTVFEMTKPTAQTTANSPQAVLINLASDEYFKAIDTQALAARVVQPVFQDAKAGQYKVVSFYAKKARGLMARFMAQEGLKSASDADALKTFTLGGYAYSPEVSKPDTWVFRRKEPA